MRAATHMRCVGLCQCFGHMTCWEADAIRQSKKAQRARTSGQMGEKYGQKLWKGNNTHRCGHGGRDKADRPALGRGRDPDCDGTQMPDAPRNPCQSKIYSTYYTTRKDNAWAQANPDEVQQVYLMTEFYTAMEEQAPLRIPLMKHLYQEQLKPNTIHDIKRWWEVIDRTTGEVVPAAEWDYAAERGKWCFISQAPSMNTRSAFWHLSCGTCTYVQLYHK